MKLDREKMREALLYRMHGISAAEAACAEAERQLSEVRMPVNSSTEPDFVAPAGGPEAGALKHEIAAVQPLLKGLASGAHSDFSVAADAFNLIAEMAVEIERLSAENATLSARVEGWREDACRYAQNVEFWRPRAERAEARVAELEAVLRDECEPALVMAAVHSAQPAIAGAARETLALIRAAIERGPQDGES